MDASLAPHDDRWRERYDDIDRTVESAGEKFTTPAYKLKWRERTVKGKPTASLHNARLAVDALGVECRYDLFHDKILIGYGGDEVQHVVRELAGEFTDNALIQLRQLASDRFGFDLTAAHIYDAVRTLALQHCFDPVLDLLDAAQRNWDKTPRLDTWTEVYLGCEDTPLNRAIGRKVLVAAARRARVPGDKYDNITVLESPEGKNKSTAIRILAGDENFSDQSILGASDKVVQEQLSGVWMHENADLAGMKRADVEHIKAFASRQVDRARPAYGRVREDRKRRSIEWGTTNNKEYLLSQTGNRRFWTLETGKIDLEALRRDRLQLLGEAATYEAAGESVVLDTALWGAALAAQEERRVKDPWEDILDDIPQTIPVWSGNKDEDGDAPVDSITIIHLDAGQEKVSSKDLLEHILKIPPARQGRFDAMRLADVMKAVGWCRTPNGKVRIEGAQVRGYWREEVM
jgi:predicted P-loop ATPase